MSGGLGATDRMCIVDLLDVPLLLSREGEQGDGAVRAAARQNQAKLVWTPTHRVHCIQAKTHTTGMKL